MSNVYKFQAFTYWGKPCQFSFDEQCIYCTSNGDVQRREITAQQNYDLRLMAFNDYIGPMNIFEVAVYN